MPPFQKNICLARAVIGKWKRLGATTAQPRSGRPHKLTERDRRVLKRIKIDWYCLYTDYRSKVLEHLLTRFLYFYYFHHCRIIAKTSNYEITHMEPCSDQRKC
ncbi:unnamed protein product [Oncorhynchus mykiss]|uniref:Uncharacterized protein n=1 Tax=Oncorhynchus mykiss TaxID=8022 RepID=A0A060XKE2_ONCMY|nr:unnamed protein product [Oncorhynchus mykiss]